MASTTIDVYARVHSGSLNKGVQQIRMEAGRAGTEAGDLFASNFATGVEKGTPRVTRSFDELTKSTDRIRQAEERLHKAWLSGDREKVISATNKLAQANKNATTETERFERAQRNLHQVLTGDASNAGREVTNLTSKLAMLGSAVRGAGPAALAVGAVPATAAIGQLFGVLASASQSLIALPAIAGAAAAGIGTVALATKGFGDALADLDDTDKFVEDLRKLSPNAAQAALAIRSMKPAFDDLQQSTQDAFFANIGVELQQLSATVLPEVKALTTSVATSLNGMLTGVMSQLQTPEGLAAIHAIVTNIAAAFQNLQPAVAPATQAIMTLVQAGSGALPALATAATNAANAFANWARNGDLQTWLAEGLTTLEQIGPAVGHLVDAFFQLGDIGRQALPDIVRVIDQLADALPGVIQLATDLSTPFMTLSKTIDGVSGSWNVLSSALKVSPFGEIDAQVLNLKHSLESMLNPLGAILDAFKSAGRLFGLTDEGSAISNAQAKLNDALSQAKWGVPTPGATAAPGAPGTPSGPPTGLPIPGGIGGGALAGLGNNVPSSNAWNSPANPYGVSGPSKSGGSGSGSDGPQVPYPSTDPVSLLPKGMPITAALYQSAQSVIDAQWKVAQDQATLNALQQSNTATESDLVKARNDLVKDQQDAVLAQQRLVEAQQKSNDQQLRASETAAKSFDQMSAALDSDLGLSKGLPGLADNLVRFLGALATAPIQGILSQITGGKSASETGSGIVGMATSGMPQYQQPTALPAYAQMPYVPGPMPGLGSDVKAAASHVGEAYSQALRDDCSGTIGQIINEALGIAGGNLPTTSNMGQWLAERGFQPGLGGPGDMSVGWWDGAGNDGHAAATLSNGMNFEQGGSGNTATMGGPVGASSSQFTNQMHRSWTPSYSGGGGPSIGMPTTTPVAPGAYAPLSPTQLTDPGLTPPPLPTGGGGMSVPGSMAAPPQTLPGLSSSQINNPGQDPNAWQPAGGGGNAGLGGLAMSAISSAISAAGMAGDAAGGGGGGSAAAAAAQLAMQAINRTIAFGGQAAGDLVGGLFETFSVGGSSLADPMQGWLGRLVGSLAGAKPATPTTAGDGGKDQLKPQQDPNAQGQQDQKAGKGGNYGTYVENFIQAPNRDGAQKVGNDLAFQTAGQGSR